MYAVDAISRAILLTRSPPCPHLAGRTPEEVAEAFTQLLDTHVERVNDFYQERIEEGVIILHALHQHCERIVRALFPPPLCPHDLTLAPSPLSLSQSAGAQRPEMRASCQKSLVAIHFQLLLLQNYVALNFTAVTKILKKFEKKFEIAIRNDYIGAIVELPFYRCDALGDLVEETERQFNALAAMSAAVAAKQPQAPQGGAGASAMMPPPPPLQPQQQQQQHLANGGVAAAMPPPPPRPPTCADPALLQQQSGNMPTEVQ